MRTLKQGTGRTLALLLAGAVLASCAAHGQSKKLDPKVYVNHTPYSESFFRELMAGRVYIYERNIAQGHDAWNQVQGSVFGKDGSLHQCFLRSRNYWRAGRYGTVEDRWLVEQGKFKLDVGAENAVWRYSFYQPQTGGLTLELYSRRSRKWRVSDSGWVQESWPRVLANECPKLRLPAGLKINEKQTSLKFDELRRQDPDAPIRHFPGSHLTAPGRTGLGASGGRPTTTREEVFAFLRAQEGDVVTSPSGAGYVFSLEGGQSEVWRLADDGGDTKFGTLRDEGDWAFVEVPGQPALKYPVGYPVPVLPTGHRHAAWQLTDELIARAELLPLPWMGARYGGHRFLFHDKTLTVVAPGETYLTGRWRWTKGQLQVWVDGEEQHAGSIAWRDLAHELGVTPTVWTPGTPDRID